MWGKAIFSKWITKTITQHYTCFIASFPGFHHLQQGGLGMRLLGSCDGRISLQFIPRLCVLKVQSALSHTSYISLLHTHTQHSPHTHTQPSPHTHKCTFTLYSSPHTHPFPTLSPHSPPLIPGMIAAMTRHLKSLRYMQRDHGWIHTLLEEAENERMHLLTAMVLRNPGPIFKASVIGTQGTQLRVCSL